MPKLTSSYIKGLSQDLAIAKNDNEHLYNALDIDLVTDTGESTGIISNHKGNKLQFSIPNIQPLFSIKFTPVAPIAATTLTINGTAVVISLSSISDSFDIYSQIIADATIAADIAAGEYGVYYNTQEVLIQGYSLNPNVSVTLGNDLTVTTVVAAQTDLSIIGWGTLEEEIILLTTSRTNTSATPSNTAGQVWVLQYNDATNTVIGLSGTSLVAATHLRYNNILNFSLANEVYREALGRRESSLRGTFYWTDDYNHPRALNIYNPQCPAIPVGLLDWKPSVDMSTPIIENVLEGGLLVAGSYQFAYQLYSKDGGVTAYSPASTLVPITDSNLNGPYFEYDGAAVETPTGKSIAISISHIDLRYDFIKIVSIEYSVEDVPIINYVYDLPIDGETMEFVISGGEDKIAISVEEFVNPLIFFDRVKTFTQKKNRLYPANTRTTSFEVNYDSRAYRFDNTQVCKVFSRDGSYKLIDNTTFQIYDVNGTPVTPYNVPDNEDAVNAYNDESGQIYGLLPTQDYDDWLNNYQYKYQTDGTTIGGEGPNVSYKFTFHDLRGDSQMVYSYLDSTTFNLKNYNMTNAPFVENLVTSAGTVNFGTPALDGFYHPIQGWGGYKNPLKSTIYDGYSRGEIYRFGVVFYNDKGQESFVNWIADIRIPEPWEGTISGSDYADLSTYEDDGFGDKRILTRSMGVEFTFNNLPANITGIRIVRVQRQKKDKTRFGTGAVFGLLDSRIKLAGTGVTTDCLHLLSFSNSDTNSGGNPEIPMLFINNDFSFGENWGPLGLQSGAAPAHHGANSGTAAAIVLRENRLGIIKFPEFDFGEYQVGDASHIKLIQSYLFTPTSFGSANADTYYTGVFSGLREFYNQGVCYWADYIDSAARQAAAFLAKYKKVSDLAPIDGRGRNIVNILDQQEVDIEGIIPSSFSPAKMASKDYHHISIYTLPEQETVAGAIDWQLSGFASKSLFCDFNGICNQIDAANAGSHIDNPTVGLKDPAYRVVSLCRYNFGQYGGPWRASRYNNVYIGASDFFPKSILANSQAIDVFGGDIYCSYYSTTLSFFHWKESYGIPFASPSGLGEAYDPVARSMSALAIAFPAETTINTEYRDGLYWNNSQVFTSQNNGIKNVTPGAAGEDFAKFLVDEYTYNRAYSQDNNLKVYSPKPFNFDTDEDQPNWVWVSEEKFDREIEDNWRRYLINNYLALEGNYGEINKITNLKEAIIAFQSRAIAQVSSQENTAVPDAGTGAVYQVGTGNVLARYDYLSKDYGSFHQHSVVTGPAAIYSFDARTKKFFRVGQGLENISDVKGLSAFFRKKLQGLILDSDQVLLNTGIHGAYDTKYNKVYMTFMNKFAINFTTVTVVAGSPTKYILNNYTPSELSVLTAGDIFYIDSNVYKVEDITTTQLTVSLVTGSITPLLQKTPIVYKFTIAFNEMLQAFESFYSFTPPLYLPTGKRLLSSNPFDTSNSVYLHNEGNFGQFYGQNPSIAEAEFILNFPDATKVATFRIDTLEFWSEVFDSNGIDIPLETISGILLYNDYQTTGSSLLLLTPQQNVVRRERTWRINAIRDFSSPLPIKPFLRDVYVKIKIFYNNQNNRYFRLNDFNTNITMSYH
jgi:hypothetical protein